MKNCRKLKEVWEKNFRIEYETDAIKDQNSTLELQKTEFSLCSEFLTILGLFIYTVKLKKLKNRGVYKQQATASE
jgi:hypothetical protein